MVEFLTETEVGAILRRSRITLSKWRAKGCGPKFVKIGGRVLYESRALAEYLRAQGAGDGPVPAAGAAPGE